MTPLLSARSQMGFSLAFHIIFAAMGVSPPLMMTVADWRWLQTKEPVYLILARRWAKGAAILFALGAVSGTALSFELGLLWPRFMEKVGSVIGMPFSLEGFAFFARRWRHRRTGARGERRCPCARQQGQQEIRSTLRRTWGTRPEWWPSCRDTAVISGLIVAGE
jgi:hypothetical protein